MKLLSSLDVMTAAESRNLTTLSRVKAELNINDGSSDYLLSQKIAEASDDIVIALGYDPIRETVRETFWWEYAFNQFFDNPRDCLSQLFLRKLPIVSITSVILDGNTLDATQYRIDANTGILTFIETDGTPTGWFISASAIVEYIGGYITPGTQGQTSNVKPAIEAATIGLIKSFWFNKDQNPNIQSESVVGLASYTYWAGSGTDSSMFPPEVSRLIAPLKRTRMAVA